jgi:hypothetical protein
MSVLILHHRGSLEATPYTEWLSDYDGNIILLASQEAFDATGDAALATADYSHAEALADYEASGRVEARALDLAGQHSVRHVIACQERDLDRAARLREILGLPGQTYASTVVFRHKIFMKDAVSTAGVPVAAFRSVECAVDVISFAQANGLPIVVKPRDGAGSFGVSILRTQADLDRFLADFEIPAGTRPNLMAEEFVSESMCHVDGLVVGHRVIYAWPSQYMYALAVFQGDLSGRLDVTLDADDPLGRRLLDLTARVLTALPSPSDFAFHAEIFRTPDDRLVLGEIACRPGGAAQRDIQRVLFGVDPTECSVRAQLGLPLPFRQDAAQLEPAALTGQLALLKRAGRVLKVPGQPPFSWIEKQTIFIQPGDIMEPAAFAADFMALFVISAPSRDKSVQRMRQLEKWFLAELVLAGGLGQESLVASLTSPDTHS